MSRLNKSYKIYFDDNGQYKSSGSFLPTKSGYKYTYDAVGNSITIYMDGDEIYRYTVTDLTSTSMNVRLDIVSSSNSMYFNFQKQ